MQISRKFIWTFLANFYLENGFGSRLGQFLSGSRIWLFFFAIALDAILNSIFHLFFFCSGDHGAANLVYRDITVIFGLSECASGILIILIITLRHYPQASFLFQQELSCQSKLFFK